MYAGSQNRQFVRPPHEAGFTLIEIVMCLTILGILAAVAVPKYFDLQESGRVTVCQHNRDVIRSTIEKRQSLAGFTKDTSIFDSSSELAATLSAQKILDELYPADGKETACPSGGVVGVRAIPYGKDDYTFRVSCSFHASDSLVVTRSNPQSFVDWFQRSYQVEMKLDKYGQYPSLSKLFQAYSAELDSEAGNFNTTIAAVVAEAAEAAGLDMSRVIWRVSKDNWRGCQGKSCSGKLYFTFAAKADATKANEGNSIPVTQYVFTVKYDENGNATFLKPSSVESNPRETTAKLVWKTSGTNKKLEYWALETS